MQQQEQYSGLLYFIGYGAADLNTNNPAKLQHPTALSTIVVQCVLQPQNMAAICS